MYFLLSPSSLHLFKECPRCFWLQLREGFKRPASIFPSLPAGMDQVLKDHFDNFRDKGLLPPELKNLENTKLFDNKELLEKWRNWRQGLRYAENDNVLSGALDNLLVRGEELIVLDYKTRGYPVKDDTASHYQHQMDIYSFLLEKQGYKVAKIAYLLFYHPTHVEPDGDVGFHAELVEIEVDTKRAEKLWKDALTLLNGECPDFTDCGFCAYRAA